jgi:hypothetical protein
MPYCDFCRAWFPTTKGVAHHRGHSPLCKDSWRNQLLLRAKATPNYSLDDPESFPRNDEPEGGYEPLPHDDERLAMEPLDVHLDLPTVEPENIGTEGGPPVLESLSSCDSSQPTKTTRRLVKAHTNRSQTYGCARTVFETRRDEEKEHGDTPYRHFKNAEAFEAAEWMLDTELSQRAETRLLKTKMVRLSHSAHRLL